MEGEILGRQGRTKESQKAWEGGEHQQDGNVESPRGRATCRGWRRTSRDLQRHPNETRKPQPQVVQKPGGKGQAVEEGALPFPCTKMLRGVRGCRGLTRSKEKAPVVTSSGGSGIFGFGMEGQREGRGAKETGGPRNGSNGRFEQRRVQPLTGCTSEET